MPISDPHLLIDASSIRLSVGILCSGNWLAWQTLESQALEGIFSGVSTCLHEAKIKLHDIRGFIHCMGPGSVLGIRMSAMAIHTWKAFPQWQQAPVVNYRILHLVRSILQREDKAIGPLHIISEAHKNSWNCLSDAAETSDWVDQEQLVRLPGDLYYLQQRKTSHQPPQRAIHYELQTQKIAEHLLNPQVSRVSDTPEIPYSDPSQYQKWNGQRHTTG